jgi:DNA-binding HxlR family transcriptional regulator
MQSIGADRLDILADRLTRLEKVGLVSRRDDPSHKQKVVYNLTEASIALVPLLAHLGGWGCVNTQPASAMRPHLAWEELAHRRF